MSRELDELMANLRDCDLKMAAFDLAKSLGGGVYANEMSQELQLFTKLPSPETGVILIAACPEAAQVLAQSNSGFANNLPKEWRGPHFDGLDERMASFDKNISACDAIQKFLLDGYANGTISVGFHRMRDQQVLLNRLATIGIHKRFFSNRRQFLRDKITLDASAFRSVVDRICIRGIHRGHEHFWNALGAEHDPQWHLQSEIQYDLSVNSQQFSQLIDTLTHREPNGA